METVTEKCRRLMQANHIAEPDKDVDDFLTDLLQKLKTQSESVKKSDNESEIYFVLDAVIIKKMLLQLMSDAEESEKTKVIKVLGVLAESSLNNRACLFGQAVVIPLVDLLNNSPSEEVAAAVIKTYKSLCMREMAMENIGQYSFGLPAISPFLFHSNQTIVADTITVLGYIAGCHSYRPEEENDEIIVGRSGVKVITDILSSCDHPLHDTALEAVVNIAFLNENQTQILMECDFLSYVSKILMCEVVKHRKFACWVLANLTSKVTSEQIAAIFETQILRYVMHEILDKPELEPETVKYSLWTLQNVTYNATSEQVAKLVSDGCIEKLCKYLPLQNKSEIIKSALDSLDNILPHGEVLSQYDEPLNQFLGIVTSCDGICLFENILKSKKVPAEIKEEAKDLYQYYYQRKRSVETQDE